MKFTTSLMYLLSDWLLKRNTLLSAKKKLGITSGKSKLDDGTSF